MRLQHGLCLLLLLSGTLALINGGWIYAKAQLAQQLLLWSWQQRLSHPSVAPESTRPWPWADTYAEAELRVHALEQRLIVLHGDSGRTLAFGPGLSANSSAPGQPGVTLISGHRDTHFGFLQHLQAGMQIELRTPATQIRYRVLGNQVIDNRNGPLTLPDDSDLLVLLTCYPFDSLDPGGPLRYLVWAEAEPVLSI